MPTFLPSDATSLIKSLLERNQDRRLGAGPQGTENVKGHKFFASVNWSKIQVRGVAPPFRPTVEGEMCVACFDEAGNGGRGAADDRVGQPDDGYDTFFRDAGDEGLAPRRKARSFRRRRLTQPTVSGARGAPWPAGR